MKYEHPTIDVELFKIIDVIKTSNPGLEEDFGGGDNIDPNKDW